MLGEKRSRAAFQEDSGEGVQTVGCAAHGKPEVENTGTKYTNTGGAKAEEPAPPLSGEAYLDKLVADYHNMVNGVKNIFDSFQKEMEPNG